LTKLPRGGLGEGHDLSLFDQKSRFTTRCCHDLETLRRLTIEKIAAAGTALGLYQRAI